jgi:hypothetical protein
MLLDIAPTLFMYENTSMAFVSTSCHRGDSYLSFAGRRILALVLPHPTVSGTSKSIHRHQLDSKDANSVQEKMIMADPSAYWQTMAGRPTHRNVVWDDQALSTYQTAFNKPETIHAVCQSHSHVFFMLSTLTPSRHAKTTELLLPSI